MHNKKNYYPYESQSIETLNRYNMRNLNSKNFPKAEKSNIKFIPKKVCNSLNEVEYFLQNFSSIFKYLKKYYLIKK